MDELTNVLTLKKKLVSIAMRLLEATVVPQPTQSGRNDGSQQVRPKQAEQEPHEAPPLLEGGATGGGRRPHSSFPPGGSGHQATANGWHPDERELNRLPRRPHDGRRGIGINLYEKLQIH